MEKDRQKAFMDGAHLSSHAILFLLLFGCISSSYAVTPSPDWKNTALNRISEIDCWGEVAQDSFFCDRYEDDRYERLDYERSSANDADIRFATYAYDGFFYYIEWDMAGDWNAVTTPSNAFQVEFDIDAATEADRPDIMIFTYGKSEFVSPAWIDAYFIGGYESHIDSNNDVGAVRPTESDWQASGDGYETDIERVPETVFARIINDNFQMAVSRSMLRAYGGEAPFFRIWIVQEGSLGKEMFTPHDLIRDIDLRMVDNTRGVAWGTDNWINPIPTPTVELTKWADKARVPLGERSLLLLKLAVHNQGDASIYNAVIQDALPNRVDFVPGSILTARGTADWGETTPDLLTWDLGTLLPDEYAVLFFEVEIMPPAPGNFTVNDGAVFTGVDSRNDPVNIISDDVTVEVVVLTQADPNLNFDLLPDLVAPVSENYFTYCVKNEGNDAQFDNLSDEITLTFPSFWGDPSVEALPGQPTPEWAWAWNPSGRSLTFRYPPVPFTWLQDDEFCFDLECTSPVDSGIHYFLGSASLEGQGIFFNEILRIQVADLYVEMAPDHTAQGRPCTSIYHAHAVINLGMVSDMYDLTASSTQGWPTTFFHDADSSGSFTPGDLPLTDHNGSTDVDTGPVAPMEYIDILVRVDIPDGATPMTEVTQVRAQSMHIPEINAMITDTTDAVGSPGPDITPDDPEICSGETMVLDAGDGSAHYLWCTGEDTRTIAVSPVDTSSYSVTVTDDYGCTAQDTVTVNVLAAPQVAITPRDQDLCWGNSMNLDAGEGFLTYAWSTGETTQMITVSPDAKTSYSVIVTDERGCAGVDSIQTTVVPPEILKEPGNILRAVRQNQSVHLEWNTAEIPRIFRLKISNAKQFPGVILADLIPDVPLQSDTGVTSTYLHWDAVLQEGVRFYRIEGLDCP